MENIKDLERIAQEASNWWTDTISTPRFDNGADSVEGMYASALAMLNVKGISATQLSAFREELYNHILGRIQNLDDGMSIIIGCDYGPCSELNEIAKHCDIPTSNFPWKTTMWIYNDACLVRYGYGAGIDYIWDSESYWERKLVDNRKSIKYWLDEGKTMEDELIKELMTETEVIKSELKKYKNK